MKVINENIDVVCSFSKDGIITIDRFRIQENDETFVVEIKHHRSKETVKIAGEVIYLYKCTAIINAQIKPCELRFKRNTLEWILYKI